MEVVNRNDKTTTVNRKQNKIKPPDSKTYWQVCGSVRLSDRKDGLFWKLEARGRFSVGSLYRLLKRSQIQFPYSFLWNIKVPLKIKVFLWLVHRRSILTREVLSERGIGEEVGCLFCSRRETADHLFFSCSLAKYVWRIILVSFDLPSIPSGVGNVLDIWLLQFGKRDRKLVLVGFAAVIWVIWKTRNDACFRNMMPNDPSAVVFAICAMINHWSGLQKSSSQEVLRRFSRRLWRVTADIFRRSRGWAPVTRRLTNGALA